MNQPAQVEPIIPNNSLPGQAFTADDQCKMIYGSNSTFCHVNNINTTLTVKSSSKINL